MTRFPGLPDELWQHGSAICIELTDWDGFDPGPDWVPFTEAVLAALGLSPVNGFARSGNLVTGRIRGPETRGAWRKIRGRAGSLLGTHAGRNTADANTGYDYRVGESNRDGYLAIQRGTYFPAIRREFAIAVAKGVADSPNALLRAVGQTLSEKIRPKWGGIFEFPVAAGADFYLGNVGYTGPEIRALGRSTVIMAEHGERLFRVNNRSSTEFAFGVGYVREIYEINFLSAAHLRAPLLGASVKDYAESVGTLAPSELWPDLHEWRLNDQELSRARRDWENSGLVLAAEREPFRWQ